MAARVLDAKGDLIRRVDQLYEMGNLVAGCGEGTSWQTVSARAEDIALGVRGSVAECDFLAGVADEWDSDLPCSLGQLHVSTRPSKMRLQFVTQSSKTACRQRSSASRLRQSNAGQVELVISGTATEGEGSPESYSSPPHAIAVPKLWFSIFT